MTKSRDPLTMEPLVCKNIVQLKFCCHTLDTQNLSHISDYDNKPKTLILYFVSKRIPITDILFQTPLVSVTLLENPTLPVQQHISIKAIIYGSPVSLPFAQCPPPTLPSRLLSRCCMLSSNLMVILMSWIKCCCNAPNKLYCNNQSAPGLKTNICHSLLV